MNKNIQQFNVDSPDPVVLPDDVSLTNIAQKAPPNRNSVSHTNTSRNNISTQKTSTQNTNNVKSNCNCGIYTGYRYEFSIVYKKTEQAKNPNTNQIRRDWLYIQLIGNINSNNVKSDRFLIYLK
jgi:hypothetical protein